MGRCGRQMRLLVIVFISSLLAQTVALNVFNLRSHNKKYSNKDEKSDRRKRSDDTSKSDKRRSRSESSKKKKKPCSKDKKSNKSPIKIPDDKSIWEYIVDVSGKSGLDDKETDFDILRDLIIDADLQDSLGDPDQSGLQDITLFAPRDKSFYNFAKDLGYKKTYDEEKILDYLAKELAAIADEKGTNFIAVLRDILRYHIGAPSMTDDKLLSEGTIATLYQDERLVVEKDKKDRTKIVGNGCIDPKLFEEKKNIKTTNGMLHYIKYVLFPFGGSGNEIPTEPGSMPTPSPMGTNSSSLRPTSETTPSDTPNASAPTSSPVVTGTPPTVVSTNPPVLAPTNPVSGGELFLGPGAIECSDGSCIVEDATSQTCNYLALVDNGNVTITSVITAVNITTDAPFEILAGCEIRCTNCDFTPASTNSTSSIGSRFLSRHVRTYVSNSSKIARRPLRLLHRGGRS